MKIKLFFQDLMVILNLDQFFKKLFLGLGIILFSAFVINLSAQLYEVRTTRAFVFSYDNDAGRGVQTAVLTRWWNSNHFAPYGNLYFRFAHTLAKLAPVHANKEWSATDKIEIQHHYALLLVSLLSLTAFCLYLGYLISERWDYAFWMANIFIHLAVLDQTWVKYIFIVHPDHLLMLMTLFASYFTLKYTKDHSRRDFIISAILWGIVTAVKKATILFIPSFLFLFLSEGFNKQSLIKGIQFVGFMLLAYLVVGFPQNFSIYKHIRFLITESANGTAANVESVTEYLALIFNQSKYLILAMIPMQVLFGTSSRLMNKKFLAFTLIAILVLLSGNMISTKEHHVMPHVALILITFLFALKLIPTPSFKYKTILLSVLGLITLGCLNNVESTFVSQRDNIRACAPEAEAALEVVKKIQQDKTSILLRDPYFPFDSAETKLTIQHWGMSLDLIDQSHAQIIGSKIGFLTSYETRPHKPHVDPDIEKWKKKIEFSRLAPNVQSFTTPQGNTFNRIYQDKCGYVVWSKK